MSDLIARSSVETFQPDSLLLGGLIDFGNGTLASGQNLARGAVLGRVTATGKLVASVQTATDGSQEPVAVLVHDIDASAGDADCQFVRGGWVNSELLTWDATWTAALQASAFDGTPIRVVSPE